jgi:hypothetical protein
MPARGNREPSIGGTYVVLLHILIPTVDNDGAVFTDADHEAFEAFVLARFGGLTQFPSTAMGAWTDAGRVYRDRTRVYAVAITSVREYAKFVEVVAFAKAHYRQLAMFIHYLGQAEIL